MPCARASVRSPISGITSLRLVESAMYSASVVDLAVMVCILDAHVMGAPAKRTIQPERDLAVIGSLCASAWRQFPAKSASTQQSNWLALLGCMIMPLSRVASRYRPIHFTASLGMAFLGCLREVSALVDADRDVRSGGLLQEVQFPNDATVMEFRLHIRTVGVLMQQCGGHRWR